MGRSPKARDAVLDAAERLVKSQGAGCLTYERLAEEAGVTRGGITYHFPTKQSLLQALIERDIAQWKSVSEELAPKRATDADAAATIAHVRSCCEHDRDHQRLIAGLVAAATHEPSLLDPVRAFHAQRYAERNWTDRQLRLYLLEMAAEGLFWQDLYDTYRLPDAVRARLVRLLEELAHEWGRDNPQDQGTGT